MTLTPSDPRWKMCDDMLSLMQKGLLMPFLGAGVNLADRPPGTTYVSGGRYLPNGSELSDDLLRAFQVKLANPCEVAAPLAIGGRCKWKEQSLLRVSWYVSAIKGEADLYHRLQEVFTAKYEPTEVHKFFARFRRRLAEKGYKVPRQLIVTTNYDELLEHAFDAEKEPYDVFSYVLDDDSGRGKFIHIPYKRSAIVISNPQRYLPPKPIKHTIILKIHGTVHPEDFGNSTFVITEDDYLDYAAFVALNQIPLVLKNIMKPRRFLYLGYSLSDWNFRVFLRGIKSRFRFNDPTWAIMLDPDEWDRLYWQKHKVEIIEMSLADHIEILNKIIDAMPTVT